MNKTININLGGTFFHIDESAYKLLQQYLEKLKITFSNTQGKEEIIEDIESRIAELLREIKKHADQVIVLSNINSVIDTMGQPKDFISEDDEERFIRPEKKLFRNPEDRYIGGVISGLGSYFGIETIWMRIIWLILTVFSAGAPVIVYIIMWALIPEAKTTAEKLQMKGEPVNISTIEKKIKEEFDEVSEKIKNADYRSMTSTVKKKSETFFSILINLLGKVFKIIGVMIGILFLIISSVVFTALIISIFSIGLMGFYEYPEFFANFSIGPDTPFTLISFLVFISLLIPMVFLFLLGMKLLNPKSKSISLLGKLILLGIWLVSIFTFLFFGFAEAKSQFFISKTESECVIQKYSPNTFYFKQGTY
mgnify:FL=1